MTRRVAEEILTVSIGLLFSSGKDDAANDLQRLINSDWFKHINKKTKSEMKHQFLVLVSLLESALKLAKCVTPTEMGGTPDLFYPEGINEHDSWHVYEERVATLEKEILETVKKMKESHK